MNEVEKMYEKANIRICKRKQGFTLKDCTDRNCKECGYYDMLPFTTEKQLELIKWLSKFNLRIEQPDYAKDHYFIETHTGVYSKFLSIFEEALAGLINNLWQDLTDAEKAGIKNILESEENDGH